VRSIGKNPEICGEKSVSLGRASMKNLEGGWLP
jgi:hypothetical protein